MTGPATSTSPEEDIDAFAKLRRRFLGRLLSYVFLPHIALLVLFTALVAIGWIPEEFPRYSSGIVLLAYLITLPVSVGFIGHLDKDELAIQQRIWKQLSDEQKEMAFCRVSPLLPVVRQMACFFLHLTAALALLTALSLVIVCIRQKIGGLTLALGMSCFLVAAAPELIAWGIKRKRDSAIIVGGVLIFFWIVSFLVLVFASL